MPTWLTVTALLLWLACPVLYTVMAGRHYAHRCRAELAAVQSCVDDIHELHDTLFPPAEHPPSDPQVSLRPEPARPR